MSDSSIVKSLGREYKPFKREADSGSLVVSWETSQRLKQLVQQVEDDAIEKANLIQALNKICTSVHNLYIAQKREILANDSEFSELLNSFNVEDSGGGGGGKGEGQGEGDLRAAMVSKVVRSWLETTFTKQAAWHHNTSDVPRLTFKQAAIKIKAGIKLHRLFGTGAFICLKPSPEANKLFRERFKNWSFDVFHLNSLIEGHVLTYMGVEIFQRHRICDLFNIPCRVLEAFLSQLERGYSKHGNPYHNCIHAADVVHTCNSIMEGSGLTELMTEEEKFALLFSALIHDFEHAGTTNAYQINIRSHLALLYNDRGVLENHHISAAYRVTQLPAFNIFVNVPRSKFQAIRQLVIEMVLNTDMSLHFSQIKVVSKLLKLPEPIEKPKAFSLLLHAADISHPTKCWDLHERWTYLLVEEFFNQGDREAALGLPCSPLCDRHTTMVPESQVGFINFIVVPTFQLLKEMLERIYRDAKKQQQSHDQLAEVDMKPVQFPGEFKWMEQLQENRTIWEARARQYAAENPIP
ncbi:Calcium/calmodulin-dependent 3',5'-cyclic nucleotide phosphodiesterase 1C [Echinococcus granulosus]|uniref:Phosphodiesterase n=1 Tax=Echinococcus granulosus TaxID=6210 RepID=A0A068WGQ3_ECHGR|nr:Calcium/calmodulin-dependent 3',5'-cyclic nucleotide phosphodiesterase 1C [Echinococcus granulosus]CDS16852.1 calcium:calmodulin dependent 3'5' cyclic [Echinococcus granulosus]